mmetsp:Transcript_24293/g.50399  ORF Transcript_24293/g.50399 Transcript_24293/m.50399 type:complete len:478 (+) Transcript_24293:204-1637(+)
MPSSAAIAVAALLASSLPSASAFTAPLSNTRGRWVSSASGNSRLSSYNDNNNNYNGYGGTNNDMRNGDMNSNPINNNSNNNNFNTNFYSNNEEYNGNGGGNGDENDLLSQATLNLRELATCASLLYGYLSKPSSAVTAQDVVLACDAIDEVSSTYFDGWNSLFNNDGVALRRRCHELGRYQLLVKLMEQDYDAYVATAAFLSPSRIDRKDLPNVQDVPFVPSSSDDPLSYDNNYNYNNNYNKNNPQYDQYGQPLVADCALPPLPFDDSPLDKLLLFLFRRLVAQNTGGVQNDIPGIQGLVAQAKTFMLQPYQTAEAQHLMVKQTLGGLMTPVLPPVYRLFMSGIVGDAQYGPLPYAPFLTSVVTPPFFGFLVGPSRPNRRRDGKRGGLVVEKCKFLQESGCKGLCLHQCKTPAEEFFRETLGMSLTVRPNFETQECQWSFGEEPIPVEQDPSFPRGCLVGCESRQMLAGQRTDALCM